MIETLQLYPRNQTDFSWNGEPISHSYDEHVIRDDTWYLQFKVSLDENEEYKKIQRRMVVKAWTLDGEQAFRIFDTVEHEDYIEIIAPHIMYDLNTKMTNPIHVTNGGLNGALNQFKQGLPLEMGPFEFSTSITRLRTYNTANFDEQDNKYNALDVFMDGAHSIVGTWEAELLINNWDIRLVESIGSRTGALLYEKKNISAFEQKISDRDIVTRIYAESTWTPEREEGDTEQPEPVSIEVIVESPLINEYEQVYERHYRNNDMRTIAELRQWAERKFTYDKLDLPTRSIKVDTNIIDGTTINYGDYVVLKYLKHDVDEEIRCVGTDINPVTHDIYDITLGTNLTTVGGTINEKIADLTGDQLKNEMKDIAERVTKIIMAANGFNRISYGSLPVPNPINGDIWYKFEFDTPNQVEMRIWQDGIWVIIIDDFLGERIQEKFEELDREFETTETKLNTNITKTDALFTEWKDLKDNLDFAQQEMFLNIIGDDGRWVYSDNRLYIEGTPSNEITSNEYILKLEDENVEFTHNGNGFNLGENYLLSWIVERVERPSMDIYIMLSPSPMHEVNIKLKPTHPKYPIHEKNTTTSYTNFPKVYHDDYEVITNSPWYVDRTTNITVGSTTAFIAPLVYRDGTLTINHNDAEILVDGESIQTEPESYDVEFNFDIESTTPNNPLSDVTFNFNVPNEDTTGVTPSVNPSTVKRLPANTRVMSLVDDFGAVGDGVTDDSQALKNALQYSNTEPIILDVGGSDKEYYIPSNGNNKIENYPGTSKGIWIRGNGAVFAPHNSRTIDRHEHYLMQIRADKNASIETSGFTIDGKHNEQDMFWWISQGKVEKASDLRLQKGISYEGADDIYIHNMTYKNMYGGYLIKLKNYTNVDVQHIYGNNVGGNDNPDSFGSIIHIDGQPDDSVLNFDDIITNGKKSPLNPAWVSWIGIVLENGTTQSNDPSWRLADRNTVINVTNSEFYDFETLYHIETQAGNVYWNSDNVKARVMNYMITAGVRGEVKERSNRMELDILPFMRKGLSSGLHHTYRERPSNNGTDENGAFNDFHMYNSTVNYLPKEDYTGGVDVHAVSHADSVVANLHNVTLNNVPKWLVANASANLYDTQVNLKAGHAGSYSIFSNPEQFLKLHGTSKYNQAGNWKEAPEGNYPPLVKNTGFVAPPLTGPITDILPPP